MKYPAIVTIGIAARNEEKTMLHMLRSVTRAATHIPATSTVEIIIGLNGCTDRTEEIVSHFIASYGGRPITFRIITTPAGLIVAQRKIFEARRSKDFIIFLDADILIDEWCLVRLIEAMLANPQAEAAWARMIPFDYKQAPLIKLMYNFADYFPDVVVRGKHLCGRAYIVREYVIPLIAEGRQLDAIDSRLVSFLGLDRGPLVDDVYYPRKLITSGGPQAVVYCKEAKIYFQPIASLKDFYYSQRRKEYEGHRIDMLFPQYSHFRKKYSPKKIDTAAYSALPFNRRVACRAYMFLYRLLFNVAKIEYGVHVWLLRLGVPLRPCNVWPALRTTKKSFDT